jgi:hypothetical protein
VFPLRFALAVTLACSPRCALAQDLAARDTLPFHAGQWAAQFAGGASFATVGALRFTAPGRAWLLDFRFSGGHAHDTERVNDTLVVQGFSSNASVNARLGRRFYQARGKSVLSFQTVGALGGYGHSCGASGFGDESCGNGWNAGVFAELGGAYPLTQRFSIGGTASVAFSYQRDTFRSAATVVSRRWSYQGSLQGLTFGATIYF